MKLKHRSTASLPGSAARTHPSFLLIDEIFERFAGRELDRLCGSDLDGVAGLRIAARTRGACAGAESAETDELNAVAADYGLRDSRNKCIDSFSSRGFARAGGGRHGVNEFLLVHFCFLKDGYNALPMRLHGGSVTLPDTHARGKSVLSRVCPWFGSPAVCDFAQWVATWREKSPCH